MVSGHISPFFLLPLTAFPNFFSAPNFPHGLYAHDSLLILLHSVPHGIYPPPLRFLLVEISESANFSFPQLLIFLHISTSVCYFFKALMELYEHFNANLF